MDYSSIRSIEYLSSIRLIFKGFFQETFQIELFKRKCSFISFYSDHIDEHLLTLHKENLHTVNLLKQC